MTMTTTTTQGVRAGFYLTEQESLCYANSWADTASRATAAGFAVSIEGIDWATACQDHGFYGAIAKVKAARLRRKLRAGIEATKANA
jgi:hypothetical protein